MRQARFAEKVYETALSAFKDQVYVYMNQLFDEIQTDMIVSEDIYELKFHIIELDVNADNNLGFGNFVREIVPNSRIIDPTLRTVQIDGTFDVLIIDQPRSSLFFTSLFEAMEELRQSACIVILSTLLPKEIEGLIFKALQQIYEQFNYFPKLTFAPHHLNCSFNFQDIIRLIVPQASVSPELIEGSMAIPLFRAQFYPNNVRMTLMEHLPPPSLSQINFEELCEQLKNCAYIDFPRLLVIFERKESVVLKEYFSEIRELSGDDLALAQSLYGIIPSKNTNLEQILAIVQQSYAPTNAGTTFYDFGQFNFKGLIIAQLCKEETSLFGIVFGLLRLAPAEMPFDELFQKYLKQEGRRFDSVEGCIQELERAIAHFAEYGLIELHLVQNNAMISRKF